VSKPSSLFGPLALIALGLLLLVHNLAGGFSLWTFALDSWPWFLVAWGGAHVVQQLLARSRGIAGPPRMGAGAVAIALLICLAGWSGRAIRANDGIVFRGFGVRVQVRDSAFRRLPPDPSPPPADDERQ
jgi:hypothetical protein